MDRTGTQGSFWLLCLLYVVFLLNHMLLVLSLQLKLPQGNVLTSQPYYNSAGLNQSSTPLTTPLPPTVLRNLVTGLVLLKIKGML